MRRADRLNVGLILDSFHTLARKIDPDTIRRIPGDRIFFVQLADAPLIEMDLLCWSRHFRNMPGEGDLDLEGFMRAVAATGYAGPLSLEVFNDQFRGGSPRTIAVDGQRSLLNLMDRVARAQPGIAIDVPAMPPRLPSAPAFSVRACSASLSGRANSTFPRSGAWAAACFISSTAEATSQRSGRPNSAPSAMTPPPDRSALNGSTTSPRP